ncbi:hypothetical protein [Clostridium sp. CF012]|uniref:hypothetical protein n=1 Tax=Clostridium sp. CF012 TaxID=2843319 RepID=UPI001C0D9CDB|nr:hypothetical protein [Clostridium sp. CF012]MBU3144694.1 hypothetical protein [Clostridium sp. CF012]
MKKLFFIVGLTLIMITLLVACKKTNDTVTIATDRNLYISTMSSVQGIKMTPDFKPYNKHSKLEYHWITDSGEFISDFSKLGKEVRNQGETVLWSDIENDKVADIKSPFDIRLEVIDSESKEIFAKTKLSINPYKGVYEIEK